MKIKQEKIKITDNLLYSIHNDSNTRVVRIEPGL